MMVEKPTKAPRLGGGLIARRRILYAGFDSRLAAERACVRAL